MYDFLTEGDGTAASLMGRRLRRRIRRLDAIREMLVHPATVTGLADAAPAVKLICDGS
ncbi:MAG: hypothetical protein R2710_05625 [Acidimicrobiales bacterium]